MLVFCLVAFNVHAGKYQDIKKGKIQFDIQPYSKIAIVIQGGERVSSIYYTARNNGWLASGAVGGLVNALAKAMASLEKKDTLLDNQLEEALGSFEMNTKFAQYFIPSIKSKYKGEVVSYVFGPDWPFKEVEQKFYDNDQYIVKGRRVYDYTPLIEQGVNIVLEVSISGFILPKNQLSKKALPYLQATAHLIVLNKKQLWMTEEAGEMAPKSVGKNLNALLVDASESIAHPLTALISTVSEKLANRIH